MEMENLARGSDETSKIHLVGTGDFVYRPVPAWESLPKGWTFVESVAVATDSQDRVYVFNRSEHPLIVFDRDGNFLRSWGEGEFTRPHGIVIGPDDRVFLSDDQDHTVRIYTTEGERLLTLGRSGHASDTGAQGFDYRTIRRAGPPFNLPTNLALSASGEMYVTDGYGNARVHKFSADGQLEFSWGSPGSGPSQFHIPHGIGIDRSGRVFVADRENSRLQIFAPNGEYLSEWTDVVRPCDVYFDQDDHVYVAELGLRSGMMPGMKLDPKSPGGRVSIFDLDGNLLSRWGGGDHPGTPGDFYAPHDIWGDSEGSVYVAEVTWSAGGNRGLAPPNCPSLQKFVRV